MARRSQQRVQRGQSLQKGLFTAVWCGGFKPRGETHAISAIVGRFNKAMATTLFNTTGYVSSPAWHSAHSCTSQIERLGLHLSIPVITQTPEL